MTFKENIFFWYIGIFFLPLCFFSLHRSLRLWETKVFVSSLLHSRSFGKRPCFRHIRGSRIFLSSLQTHMHMQTSLASFILITSRIILREHTLLLHGLLLIPQLHSLRHSTPRPFGYYWFSFLFFLQALLHEHDTTWKTGRDPNPKRHTLQNIDYMQKYPNIFTYRCIHDGDETCLRDLIRDQIRDERWPTRTCAAHDASALISFSFPEPTICSVSGGIVGLWYQPLPDVVKFTTSGSACLIR